MPIEQAAADSGPHWCFVAIGGLGLLALVLHMLRIYATVANMRAARRAASTRHVES